MPALVKSRLGEAGRRLDEGTMVWPFDLKKSRKDCLISALVICLSVDIRIVEPWKHFKPPQKPLHPIYQNNPPGKQIFGFLEQERSPKK